MYPVNLFRRFSLTRKHTLLPYGHRSYGDRSLLSYLEGYHGNSGHQSNRLNSCSVLGSGERKWYTYSEMSSSLHKRVY